MKTVTEVSVVLCESFVTDKAKAYDVLTALEGLLKTQPCLRVIVISQPPEAITVSEDGEVQEELNLVP